MAKMIWDGMSSKSFDAICTYVGNMKATLGLTEWTVVISVEPLERANYNGAQISPIYGQKKAKLEFSADILEWDIDEIKHTIIHELLHLFHREQDEILNSLERTGALNAPSWGILEDSMRHAREVMVDQLAHVVGALVDDSEDLAKIMAGKD